MAHSEVFALWLAVSLGGVQFEAFHGYLFVFAVGSIYALISAILSGALGGDFGDHHVDVATDHDVDIGATGAQGMVHFSPLSPMIIATFMSAFGGTGIICTKVLQMRGYTSLPVSVVCALGVAAGVFVLFEWIFEKTQASVNIEAERLIGLHADVTTPIPEGGVGEIAFVARGLRQNAPARSADGKAIESPAEVEIVRVVGGSYIVRRVGP